MLSCGQFLAAFGKQLEGDLPEESRRGLEAHLSHCRTCSVVVDSTAKTIRIVTESGQFEFSELLPEALVQRVMDLVLANCKPGSTPRPQD